VGEGASRATTERLPCDARPQGPRCSNCRKYGSTCGGAVTHKHLVKSQKEQHNYKAECDKCAMEVIYAYLEKHQALCQGKCMKCEEQKIPCDSSQRGSSQPGTCTNCSKQLLKCSGPVTHSDTAKQIPTNSCRFCDKKIPHYYSVSSHEATCKGKCEKCQERALPCGNHRQGRCQNCRNVGGLCSGPITRADVAANRTKEGAVCPRCGTLRSRTDYTHEKSCANARGAGTKTCPVDTTSTGLVKFVGMQECHVVVLSPMPM
jgi:hypothetical protein